MRLFSQFVFLWLLFPFGSGLAQSVRLHGYVTDSLSGEALVGATIRVKASLVATSANTYGFYTLSVPANAAVEIQVSAVGYLTQSRLIIPSQLPVNFALQPQTFQLQEVTVSVPDAERLSNQNRLLIEPQQIKDAPRLLGEADPMKVIQTLPGVKGGREGSAGLYIRGGTPDQNLILLDGIPIYNTNHLFGYLSVFNTDAIKNIQLYKNGIPARYEGRLSSVVDIAMKEGNLKTPHQSFSLSPVAGTLLLEGPVKRDTSSYLITLRRTWLDAILAMLTVTSPTRRSFNFHDVNAKYQHKFNAKHTIYASVYGSRDKFYDQFNAGEGEKAKYSFNWGNVSGLLRWNAQLYTNAFLSTSVYYSQYNFQQEDEYNSDQNDQSRRVNSNIKEWNVSTLLHYAPHSRHEIKTGVQLSFRAFNPEITQITNGSAAALRTNDLAKRAFTASLFVEDNIRLSDKVLLELGLRNTWYGQNRYRHFYAQPRVKFSYNLVSDLMLQASYDHIVQTIHLLTNTTLGQPTDLWLPATGKAPTERAHQYNFSLAKSFGAYDLSVSAYYKTIQNVIEYQEGANVRYGFDQGWGDKISTGEGLSKGIEWLLVKKTGKLSGHLSYTLSRTTRQFVDINQGKSFPFRYDRTHDGTALLTYQLSKKSKLSSLFTYNTGNAITLPIGKTEGALPPNWEYVNAPISIYDEGTLWRTTVEELKVRDLYGGRNNARMPAYHRLDISYSHSKLKKHNRIRTWTASVYNVYNRLNPYFLYESEGRIKQYAFFPVIPSISYSLVF